MRGVRRFAKNISALRKIRCRYPGQVAAREDFFRSSLDYLALDSTHAQVDTHVRVGAYMIIRENNRL